MYHGGQMDVDQINRLQNLGNLAIFITQRRELKIGLVVRFV